MEQLSLRLSTFQQCITMRTESVYFDLTIVTFYWRQNIRIIIVNKNAILSQKRLHRNVCSIHMQLLY